MGDLLNKDNTFGATFIGFAASSACFGIVSTQCYTYFRRYPLDKPFYKFLVAGLWLLEAVDSAIIGHATYYYLVTNWGNPVVLIDKPVWSLVVQVAIGAFAGAVVKACFAMRVWRFSNNNPYVTGLILLLTFSQLGAAIAYTWKGFLLKSIADVPNLEIIGDVSLGLGVATDIVTALSLCFFLRGLRTGYARDDSLVNQLTIYAVNTGILTSAVSLCTLILYTIMPSNFVYMGFYFVLSKLYANSFLATMNTRKVMRGRGTDAEHTTMPTFLMVGKVTRVEENHDHEISMNTRRQDEMKPRDEDITDPLPHYAHAW